MTEKNKHLASIFHDLASMYRFLGEDNIFKSMAYQKASQAIKGLPEDITFYLEEGTVQDIPGVGESLEKDIRQYVSKGIIERFEVLKKQVPYGLMELMDISGFGPQSLKTLYRQLGISTKDEMIRALEEGKVSELRGFGAKKVENMLRGLKVHKKIEERMLLWDALQAGERIIAVMKEVKGVKKIALAGSLRRRKETIGDIDILAAVKSGDRRKVVEYFTRSAFAEKVLAKGDTRASIVMKDNGRQADLRMVDTDEWGAALQYFTGSKDHNIHLRTIARDRGYKISEYGIFNIKDNKRLAGKSEEELYHKLRMEYIPPEMREDRGEIEMALNNKIPRLVRLMDIRGDLQMHSNWSDGLQTLDEMVSYVKKNFSYEYIAVTDHSKSSRVAGGMDDNGFLQQIKIIRAMNIRMGTDFLKAGAEVDILADGSLDLSDEVLAQLDWVTASIHSGFSHNNTDRLIRACESPYVHCIGHPTGRLIGKRDPYAVDFSSVIRAAAITGTALEINAQPDRMDMNDELAAEARKGGANIVISTDSHKPADFQLMELGVDIARRAWCTQEHILNTRSWKEIQKIIARKKQKSETKVFVNK